MHRTQNSSASRAYVPALGFDLLTPLYDPFLRFLMREQALKQRLVEDAAECARGIPGISALARDARRSREIPPLPRDPGS